MLPIPLQSASNLRDLGGWPTQTGRIIRTGLLFRAPALTGLSTEDHATLAALHLRSVCDLRGIKEAAANPVHLPGTQRLGLPIEPSVGAGLKDILRTGQTTGHMSPADMMELLQDAYRAYALQSTAAYKAVFARLLQEDGPPLLLHCSAGKDRTGFGSALILSALDVAWPHIMEDYLATNTLWRQEIATRFDLPQGVKAVLLGAHAVLLESAFDAIRQEYGSLEAYLEQAMALDQTARHRLRETFTQ